MLGPQYMVAACKTFCIQITMCSWNLNSMHAYKELTNCVHTFCPAGNEHKLSYSTLKQKYADVRPDALPALLQHALAAQRNGTPLDLQGSRSILASGVRLLADVTKLSGLTTFSKQGQIS